MNKWAVLTVALLAQASFADTNFWFIPPEHPDFGPPNTSPTALGAVLEYKVAPHVRDIADSRINNRITMYIPSLGNVDITRVSFKPLEGFISAGIGDIYPDPNVPESGLSYHWYGVAPNTELSVTVQRGVMTARFAQGSTTWVVAQNNGPVFRKLNLSLFPKGYESEAQAPTEQLPLPPKRTPLAPTFTDRISVLALYTPLARDAAGGVGGINSLISASIADMNQALENSSAASVSIENVMPSGQPGLEFNYNELPDTTGCFGSAELCRFLYHRKYVRQNAATLRNTYSADLVVMFIGDSYLCGVAYTQRPACGSDTQEPGCNVGQSYNAYAYSVVSASCGVATRTLAHEVGHQFGMEHSIPPTATSYTPSFPWSWGHWVPNIGRTIMSYQDPCLVFDPVTNPNPGPCPVQLHYSNPNVNFLAFPSVPTGKSVPDFLGRYTFNARTATTFSEAMSNFRGPAITDRLFRSSFEDLPIP